jgi:uncharacterized Tic20 family protein
MSHSSVVIAPEERALATLTHLSGLAGYIFPFGGIIVPIVIWMTKKDSPVISCIAKQAILLNLIVFLTFCVSWVLFLTILLIPFVIAGWVVLGIAAVALPIIGAIRAGDGNYYRYPVVGVEPAVSVQAHVS